ncbi:MAG TPA: glycosyltransferase family 39 protein, partial [Anaerolineae bacterium]|nr:glycosyltransferase family 39 protein [Anaerolineae bacterium]
MAASLHQPPRALHRTVWRSGAALLAVSLLALLLRALRLSFQPLWWDEGYSLYFATNPVAEMLFQTSQDIHPPLYYLLLGGWVRLLGSLPVAARLLSVAVGVATVPLAFVAGRRLGGERAGLLAALLLAISPLHVFYSQEVRMYGLVVLLGLASTALAARLLCEDEAKSRFNGGLWVLYVLTTALALYTQYYAALLPVAHTVYGLWVLRRSPRRLISWLGAQLAIVLAFVPWLLYAVPQLVPYVAQKVVKDGDRPLGLVTYLARHLATFGGGHFEGWLQAWWPLGLLPLPLIAWGVWWLLSSSSRKSHGAEAERLHAPTLRRSVGLLLTTLAIPLCAGFAFNLRYPFFPERGERLLLLALPSFLLLLAVALDGLWSRAPKAGRLALSGLILLSAVILAGFYGVPRYADDDYRPLVDRVVQMSRPGDVVFCVFPWQVGYFRSYAPQGPSAVLSPSPAWGAEVRESLDRTLVRRASVWVPAHLSLGGMLEQAIETHLLDTAYPLVNEWHGPNTRLVGYSSAQPDNEGPASAEFGGRLRLAGSRWGGSTPAAGNDVLAVGLSWQLMREMGSEARVVLRLVGGQNRTWSRRDSLPQGGAYAFHLWSPGEQVEDRHGLLVTPGTPPGDYELRLSVVDGPEGRSLEVVDGNGRPAGTELTLGMVQVVMPKLPQSPGKLSIDHPRSDALDGTIMFLGHSGSGVSPAPGDLLEVSLYWQTLRDVDEDLTAFVQLLDDREQVVAGWEAPPGAGYSTS